MTINQQTHAWNSTSEHAHDHQPENTRMTINQQMHVWPSTGAHACVHLLAGGHTHVCLYLHKKSHPNIRTHMVINKRTNTHTCTHVCPPICWRTYARTSASRPVVCRSWRRLESVEASIDALRSVMEPTISESTRDWNADSVRVSNSRCDVFETAADSSPHISVRICAPMCVCLCVHACMSVCEHSLLHLMFIKPTILNSTHLSVCARNKWTYKRVHVTTRPHTIAANAAQESCRGRLRTAF